MATEMPGQRHQRDTERGADPLAMLTRPPTREADESAVPRMIIVLFAGTKMPRPRPARASCGTTVAWVTGTMTDAPMTAQVSRAPARLAQNTSVTELPGERLPGLTPDMPGVVLALAFR